MMENKCKHKKFNMGSWGGMLSKINNDGSSRPPMVYFECKECEYRKLSFEMPPYPNKALEEVLELAHSYYYGATDNKKD